MSQRFEIGEIAILVYPPGSPTGRDLGVNHFVPGGSEVEVTSGLRLGEVTMVGKEVPHHAIRAQNGHDYACPVSWLRKKRQPAPALDFTGGEWDLIPWRPKRVTVEQP